MPVDLGFAEKCASWRLHSRFFPSKVGGLPSWLSLKKIPGINELKCKYCLDPCLFLCQVYAPYEEEEETFHRTIFVFICKNPECCKGNENGNIVVFRSQLKRNNEFYPSDPPIETENWRTDIDVKNWTKVCNLCGIYASKQCVKCKITNYCCREHQKFDWRNGHKNSCGTETSKSSYTKFSYSEYELVIQEESSSSDDESDTDEENELEKFKTMIENGNAGSLQSEDVDSDLLKFASIDDETFSLFRRKIDKHPDQILRYDRGKEPLYIQKYDENKNIPSCSNCGGERQFEFQIMPQLLNFLNTKDDQNLDWGIIAVYTCKKSCVPKECYVEEYAWKQDIISEDCENQKEIL